LTTAVREAYDAFEQTWSPPMPFLFQRRYGNEDRPIGRSYIRECMVATSQAAHITAAGEVLEWRPHDFRRIFVTDAQMGRIASDATFPGKRDREAVRA
jgi:hypothetical protein